MGAPVPEPVADAAGMIRGMDPVLVAGRFHFCTTPDADRAAALGGEALASFREAEGVSLILPEAVARAQGFDLGAPMRCLTLSVHSALDGVGLTAAVATVLAKANCPCNMVAAYHHDHAFVPADRADEALEILKALAARE